MGPELACPSCTRTFALALRPQDVCLQCPHCGERLAEFPPRPSERSGALARVATVLEWVCLLAFPVFVMAVLCGLGCLTWMVFGIGEPLHGDPATLVMLGCVVLAGVAYGLLLLALMQLTKARDRAEGRGARVAGGVSALLLAVMVLGFAVLVVTVPGH